MSNLATRVLAALVAIPVVLAAVYAGGLALAVLLAVVSGVAAWEFFRLARAAGHEPMDVIGIGVAALLPLGVHGFRLGVFHPPVLTAGAAVLLIILALDVFARGPGGRPIGAASTTWLGIAYTGALLSFGYALRYQEYAVGRLAGASLVAFPLVLTWLSDTAGYFVGRALGRHTLIPSVSPGKTVEGAVGAIVACAVAAPVYVHLVLAPIATLGMRTGTAVVFGIIMSIATQLGDLTESLIKRDAAAKDSSHLFPGHGGVLDRIDGLLFALPLAYLVFTFPHVLVPAL